MDIEAFKKLPVGADLEYEWLGTWYRCVLASAYDPTSHKALLGFDGAVASFAWPTNLRLVGHRACDSLHDPRGARRSDE